MLSAGFAQ